MMFHLPAEGYEFPCPPDSDWLPSPYWLFEEVPAPVDDVDQKEFVFRTEQLNADWVERGNADSSRKST